MNNRKNTRSKIESETKDLMRATMYNPHTSNLSITQESQTLEDEDTCVVILNQPVSNFNLTPGAID